MRVVYLILAILSGSGLLITAFAALLLFNPYALLLSAGFSVENNLSEPVGVTPLGAVVMADGEHRWHVLPQLAVPFTALAAAKQTRIPIAPGDTVGVRGNFDDISLAAFAVQMVNGTEKLFIVDQNAMKGGCCYAPKQSTFVISNETELIPLQMRIEREIDEVELKLTGAYDSYVMFFCLALLPPLALWFFVRKYRSAEIHRRESV